MIGRRCFLGAAAGAASFRAAGAKPTEPAGSLEPWTPGTLDFHQLAYGRGNSAFVLCPDGTTILIDAGTTRDSADLTCAQKPDASRRPGEWIAEYVLRHMSAAGRTELDYAVISHFHPDHLGDVGPENPLAPGEHYRLTGISDVAERLPIKVLLDRGYPDYGYPSSQMLPSGDNYVAFVRSRERRGERTERLQAGSADQLKLQRNANRFPTFRIRNLAANGEVWTGKGDSTMRLFPDLKQLKPVEYPSENMCSIALRLSYGKFDLFTGGDLTSDTEWSGLPWQDVETPVAKAAGAVEVVVANHHGYFDAVSPAFVKALRPQVFVVPAWYVAHPATLPLRRMLQANRHSTSADVFATCMTDANREVNNQLVSRMRSMEGHVVIRVASGGEQFRVFVTDNADDTDRVKLMTGPYPCA